MKNTSKLIILFLIVPFLAFAQSYFVDGKGVMRTTSGQGEVSFFGVNYTLPFAHAYRMHQALGVDMKQAIDRDVYHFARLGFNAYRIHVWDVEISDEEGNLLENEHLDLLDYLIAKLKERNIKILYTPIAYWGNGYPERDEILPGFSQRWDKCDMTRVEEAIRAQEVYLKQFVEHVNPYTGLKIKDDPDVVGFEINNEPCNATEPKETTKYVNRMVKAIRRTNCKKPVFYNATHNFFHNTQAFYDADIQGATFQWYPTGIVANRTRPGNFLPTVDRYAIPFDQIRNYKNKAKIVYEFDPADVLAPYLYPAMVRSFRSAGFQWITQFSYDPTDIAYANTEYQTHFLNLAYTPGKAISMKIAAEAAYALPRNADFGSYPTDTVFDHFRVSYREQLSVMNAPEKYFYANTTTDNPVNPAKLAEIAGCGSSPLIDYEGTGAYFLDKLDDGLWRLEVMPDAICVSDPFAKASPDKEVVTILWREWPMQIRLADLGNSFSYKRINDGNSKKGVANGKTLTVSPGVYLLSRKGVETQRWTPETIKGNFRIGEYAAPHDRVKAFEVVHQPHKTANAGEKQVIEATIIGPAQPDSVLLFLHPSGFWYSGNKPIVMQHAKGYKYSATIPAEQVAEGDLSYQLVVYAGKKHYTFPANKDVHLMDWDFYEKAIWTTRVESKDKYLTLFEAGKNHNELEAFVVKGGRFKKTLRSGDYPGRYYSRIEGEKELSAENDFLIRHYVKDQVSNRTSRLVQSKMLCFKFGEVIGFDSLFVGIITADGLTYKAPVKVEKGILRVPLTNLRLTQTVLQPQAYPAFLPDYFVPKGLSDSFRNEDIEFFEISTGNGRAVRRYAVELESVWIE